jgi:hypothetical protein
LDVALQTAVRTAADTKGTAVFVINHLSHVSDKKAILKLNAMSQYEM